MADVDLPEGAEVKRLEYRPGDRIVIKVDHELDDYAKDMLLQDVAAAFGEDAPVLILEAGMDIGVVGPEAGGTQKVHVEFSGGDADLFVRTLRQYIRRNGGSAQTVLGSG